MVRLDGEEASSFAHIVSISATFAPAAGPYAPAIIAATQIASEYIIMMNKMGGRNGVDIHGVVGTQGVIVTPRFSEVYEKLVEGATVGVGVATIGEFLLRIAAAHPGLSSALGLSAAARIFALVGGGTPYGWAVAGAFGAVINLLLPEPDPDQHGGVRADRDGIGEWERFTMINTGGANQIALLSWQGFFSARGGGGGPVYANRPWVKDWERWTLVDNADGTVSFRTGNGHFLTAEGGGGQACWANRNAIGPWEKFRAENLQGGKIALKTITRPKYVSVQKGV
jgi:hypothetical protein